MSSQATHKVLIEKRLKGRHSEVPIESVTNIVQDYKRRVLAEVTPSQHFNLQQSGYKVKDLTLRTKIRVGGLAIDPTISIEREEATGPAEEEESIETEYYFVQFVGPVKPEWLENFKEDNLVPLSYYHDFTYLVYGKAVDVKKVANSPNVRAIMPYGKSLKLDEESRQLEEVGEGKEDFWVLVFTLGGMVDETLEKIERIGVKLKDERYKTPYFEKVRATIPIHLLLEVAAFPNIFHIELYHAEEYEDEVADQIVAGNYDAFNVPFTGYINWLNQMGVDGSGVTIGICDGGIDDNHPAFTGRLNKLTTGTASHGTMVAGQAAGDYRNAQNPDAAGDLIDSDSFIYGIGVAYSSNIISRLNSGGDNDRARDIVDPNNAPPNGVPGLIMNNSWGRGTSAIMNYQADEQTYDRLVRDADNTILGNTPLIVCFSAGNNGNNGLTRPKASKNTIVTGNFENYRPTQFGANADDIDDRWPSSSIGNCADGRVKPDIVAPGQNTASAAFPQPGAISHWLKYGTGTSAASPKTAGSIALIIQWWRQRHTVDAIEHTPSPALVKAILINGAVDTGAGGPIPSEEQGWGRINLNNDFNPEVPVIYIDQDLLLQPGSADIEFDIEPIDVTQPTKITLVWTDAPGTIGSGTAGNPALVNALGLEVSQGTNTWFGNNFAGGVSQTGGVQDAIQNACPGQIVNNVQNVFIQNPSGTYHVRISPDSITGNCLDPSNPNNLPFQQDFALVIQNAELMNTEPMDVMLCIDRTGSMQGTPIASAKAAAMQFMDLIPTGDDHNAGLISYATPCSYPYAPPCDSDVSINDRASVDVDLAQVTQPMKDNMTDPTGSIASIIADDCTSIGAGLKKSAERIVDNGSPLHRKTIILLTDGKENRSPCVADILPLLRKEYRVHVIAYGHSINQAMVHEISSSTHAELLHAHTEEELAAFYHQLLAIETDEEMVDSESDEFAEEDSDTHTKRFPIVNSDSKARFIIGWVNPEVTLNVELMTPQGNTITPTNASSLAHVDFVKRSTHVIYSLDKPMGSNTDWEGEWSVKINRASGSASEVEIYTTSLLVRSSLKLILQWDKIQYFIMGLIRLKVQVVDKQYVLTDGIKMSVRAKVPVKGYSNLLSEKPKRVAPVVGKDVMVGSLSVLDTLTEREWSAIYEDREEKAAVSFKSTSEGAPMESALATTWTPHIATLKKHFVPLKDGIYTYRIKVEGTTESGARYSRIRTVSKYIQLKVDVEQVKIGLIQLILKYLRALWKWLFG